MSVVSGPRDRIDLDRHPIGPRRTTFDRGGPPRHSLGAHDRAVVKGPPPPWREPGTAIPRSIRRSYHPSQEGSLRRAVEYLAASPAARAAAGAVGRAAMS